MLNGGIVESFLQGGCMMIWVGFPTPLSCLKLHSLLLLLLQSIPSHQELFLAQSVRQRGVCSHTEPTCRLFLRHLSHCLDYIEPVWTKIPIAIQLENCSPSQQQSLAN